MERPAAKGKQKLSLRDHVSPTNSKPRSELQVDFSLASDAREARTHHRGNFDSRGHEPSQFISSIS